MKQSENNQGTENTEISQGGASQPNDPTVQIKPACSKTSQNESSSSNENLTSGPSSNGDVITAEENPENAGGTLSSTETAPENAAESGSQQVACNNGGRQLRENRLSLPALQNQSHRTQPICKFFKQGRCKHGISGKAEGTCNYAHPKPCKKFMTNGNRRQRGCTKGNGCEFFHPKICNGSLRERLCTNENCKYLHIKGTKRETPTLSTPNEDNSTQSASRTQHRRANTPQVRQGPPATTGEEATLTPKTIASFLDQLKVMNMQMQQFSNRLQKLDERCSTLQQQTPLPAARPLNVVPHPYMHPYPTGIQGQPPLPQMGGMPQIC